MSTHPQWPQAYSTWTGSFDELVETAGKVITQLDDQARRPTASLVRHYQQIGAVGRGAREGRAKRFGFDDLAAIVATKGLVKQGLGLEVATSLMNSASPAMKMAYADPVASPNQAVQTVAALMSQAGMSHPIAAHTLSLSGGLPASSPMRSHSFAGPQARTLMAAADNPRANSMSVQATQTTSSNMAVPAFVGSKAIHEIQPAAWLTVYCDTQALAAATVDERHQAADALDTLAQQLRSTS